MSFGPIVDVAIGLILVFLLMGLIVSAFQEMLATWMKKRGTLLRQSIAEMLTGNDGNDDLFRRVYGHGLILGAAANDIPSYVPSRNFTLALIDTITEGSNAPVFGEIERRIAGLPDGYVKQTLRVFVQHAAGDLDVLKADLAQWYDDAMDRLSGKYKRYSQVVAIVSGLVIAVALNVDTIRIADALWRSESLRQQTVTAAEAFQMPDTPVGDKAEQAMKDNVDNLFKLDLPIGWLTPYTFQKTHTAVKNPDSTAVEQASTGVFNYFRGAGWGGVLLAIVGWLITGLATSLGAPFWFDTLQRFLQFRGTGKKPVKAAEEGAN
ncbi:hypothetical protein [Rhizomicrobium electricum]|uniref:Uncharacterized protein n=1 Tax=Rhizomicrobium electricum TaxID=480070 RepID=A0ABP3Q736_9PROT|nr:hypothetical protein [Rhizomicrobium electricum]NIJ50313.1 hypothetical protein [Rhizomicrobium electricum]